MRTVLSHDAVAYLVVRVDRQAGTMSVCDRTSVTCFCVGTSKTPIVPVAVPTNSLRPSREASTDVTKPSCSASSTWLAKSSGHTRSLWSSEAVTANPGEISTALIGASWSWYTYSSLRDEMSTWKTLPDDETSMRRSASCGPPPPEVAASIARSRNISPSWCCSPGAHTCSFPRRSRQYRMFS